MKNKLKYLIAIVLTAVICLGCTVSASAEADTTQEELEATENTTDNANEVPLSDTNFFTRVYTELSEYAGEILCALTFIASLLLAVAYKKGLFPLIEKSLSAIGNALGNLKETLSESGEKSTALSASVNERLTAANNAITALGEHVAKLSESLEASLLSEREANEEKRQLKVVVEEQISMLYDVFMCSALPQYQKDAVGERIAKMREAVAENAPKK